MKQASQSEETYTEAETDARRESILKQVLATPPQPRKASPKKVAGPSK